MRSKLRGRRDANQGLIKARFEQQYCSVADLADLGNDIPDLLVAYGGFTVLVECKVPGTGQLSPGQERFKRDWRGPVKICRSAEEADTIAEWIRQQAMKL